MLAVVNDPTLKEPEKRAPDMTKEELQMLIKREHEKFLKMADELNKKQYGEEVARLQKEAKDLEAEIKMQKVFNRVVPYPKEYFKGD